MIRETSLVRLLLATSWLLRLPWLSDRLPGVRLRVLMYHGVPGEEPRGAVRNHYGYAVPRDRFAQQVEYLAGHCRLVSLDEIVAGDLSRRRTNVLLTFDDGYENNFTQAFPVLERCRAPALFALPTAFVERREPLWNDRLEAAVERTRVDRLEIEWEGEGERFDLRRPGQRVALLTWLMRRAVATAPERRGALVERAWEVLEVADGPESLFDDPDYRPLAPAQIARMVASGRAEFACHGVNHFMMAALEPAAQRRELEESKAVVERLSGRPCRAFCVPGGSYDGSLLDEAEAAGLPIVLTSDWGWAEPRARTLGRCGIFADYDRLRFADEVHGPVVRSLVALRRRLRGS